MSIYRRAAKRDANEPDIIRGLEAVGAKVYPLREPCDLLIRFRQQWFLVEVKDRNTNLSSRKKRAKQLAFLSETNTPTVHTVEEALQAVGATP